MRETHEISPADDLIAPAPRGLADAGADRTRAASLAAITQPRIAIPLLIALGAALYLANLGGYPMYTKGEPREAVTVFDIVHGGGIILPMRAGVEIPSKPLLMHWMAAIASLALGGVTEMSVRLPSAILAIAGMLVCYGYVRRFFNDGAGLFSAVILGTTFQYLQAGTGARVDMTLTFFLEVAFFEFLAIAEGVTIRRLALFFAIALAILAKGPVGFVLPALVAVVWMTLLGRWSLIKAIPWKRGAAIVAVLGGGWYIAAAWVGGMDFVRKQILSENIVRFTGGPSFHEGHVHPFYYLELALLGGFLPWTPFLALPVIRGFGGAIKRDARVMYLVVWMAVVLIFYSMAESKRGVYLLSMYPALAALVGIAIAPNASEPAGSDGRFARVMGPIAGVVMLLTGVTALVGIAVTVIAPLWMRDFFAFWGISARGFVPSLSSAIGERWAPAALCPVLLEIVGYAALRKHLSVERLVGAIGGAVALSVVAANFIVVPAIANTLSLRNFALEVVNTVGSDSVGYLGALDYDVAFYSAKTIPIVHLNDPDLPDYLICWQAVYRRMSDEERAGFAVALTSNPTALDGSGAMVLLRRATHPPSPTSGSLKVRSDKRDYDARERRSEVTALSNRGRISAEPPPKLTSQIGVISDS
jgi:hypothetical protein